MKEFEEIKDEVKNRCFVIGAAVYGVVIFFCICLKANVFAAFICGVCAGVAVASIVHLNLTVKIELKRLKYQMKLEKQRAEEEETKKEG